ncbi:2-keto-3-deoxy-L-rhamnonate aldolase [Rubripirellula lacrimiformis]|uniref:2-keto-3-deoxy-L-rhamnonate aldolase n=1 Tax=Rubripirellula lacrimiformis TaxID=1930273 RepID=A0A517N9T9_9BACT|nr:aldolase/citrate lyase family protein [Rubripirellula lacrimiformis]QDT03905.1 2-keto-3-deoxy-L-rhamnonate aldolase [Rubripirellula lacrimiformis]
MSKANFRDAFRSGRSLVGFQLTSFSPHWPRQLAGAIDFAFIDCEHHCFSREQVAWMCVGYRAVGIAPIVRVLKPCAALVRAAMDDGAEGVVVPYVETVQQVQEVAAAAKLRPIQGQRAAAAMQGQPLDEAMMVASRNHCGDVSLILQIESEIAVKRCDELVSVAGVDGVLVGPYDLTATLGCLGQHDDSRFQAAAQRVADIVRAKGLGAGIYFAESPAKEQMAAQWGYNLMISGCDVTLIRESFAVRKLPTR